MRKILIGVGALLLLVVAAAVAAPFLIPVDVYRDRVIAEVRNATGRDLVIDGDIGLSVLPTLAVDMSGVTFSNAEGGEAAHMVTLDRVEANLGLWPLLSGEVVVNSFVLVNPRIALEVDAEGRANWDFHPGAGPAAQTPAQPRQPGAGRDLNELRLGDVRIVNGTLSYSDARTGASEVVSDINATAQLASLDLPFTMAGEVSWQAQRLRLDMRADRPRALLAGETSGLRVDLASEPVAFTFEGQGALAPAIDGNVSLNVPSVRLLAAWLGVPLDAPGQGFGPLAIEGRIGLAENQLAFTDAAIAFDQIRAQGELRVDPSGSRPTVTGRMDVSRLDLNPYMPATSQAPGGPAADAALDAEGQAGWSDDPIDFSGLQAVDADFALSVDSIAIRRIDIGRSALTLTLQDGLLAVDLTEFSAYDGSGTLALALDGAASTPELALQARVEGVRALPLLTAVAEFERLEGHGNIDLDVATRGDSQRAMMEALRGQGAVRFENGAIIGINLAAMVRNVTTAFMDTGASAPQQTDFTELTGSFTIENGIVRNDDLSMLSPLLRLGGAGTVDMPNQRIDYRVEPRVAATLEGQGGQADAAGIRVPVIIEGPWSNVSYSPDMQALLRQGIDPGQAVEGLQQGVQQGIQEGLGGLGVPGIGGGGNGGTGGTENEAPASPVPDPGRALDGLRGVFGR